MEGRWCDGCECRYRDLRGKNVSTTVICACEKCTRANVILDPDLFPFAFAQPSRKVLGSRMAPCLRHLPHTASSFPKTSVFVFAVHTKTIGLRFEMSPLWCAFSNACVFEKSDKYFSNVLVCTLGQNYGNVWTGRQSDYNFFTDKTLKDDAELMYGAFLCRYILEN